MSRRRFVFPLAVVLRARKLQEQAGERRLIAARLRLAEARRTLEQARARLEQALAQATTVRNPGTLEVRRLLAAEQRIDACREALVCAQASCDEAQGAFEAAQADYLARVRERKALELLEAAAKQRHRREERRREGRAMDEAAIVRFGDRHS